MLLDVKFDIAITNDGNKNKTSLNVDLSLKPVEILTAMKLAEQSIVQSVQSYMEAQNLPKMTKKEMDKYVNSITFDEIYNTLKMT